MGVKLIGGDHSDPVEKWIEKVPESDYDIIASEKMVSTKPSKNLYRAIFQPFSTIVLLIHSLAKNLIHKRWEKDTNKTITLHHRS